MAEFLKQYGDTEGPLGIPIRDRQAKALEAILKALPQEDRQLCHLVTAKAPTELLDGERSDVSWISTESTDREQEIVIAKGMNDSQFAGNPLVTMNHCYSQPPVGRSLWRKRAKDGPLTGIKAKTQYPVKPVDWNTDTNWPPDSAFQLIKAGLLNGKSVGFIRLKSHSPTSQEISKNPDTYANVDRVIDEWLLVEYACTFLPTNQDSLVEAVSKSNIFVPPTWLPKAPDGPSHLPTTPAPASIPFTPFTEIEAAVRRSLEAVAPDTIINHAVQQAFHKARGGV